jgi:mRNA-degrading endonuclease RelE of RelBE toxin-antitoxin system
MCYSIEIISKAEREFLKLPEAVQRKFRRQILSLEKNPRPFGSGRSTEKRILFRISLRKGLALSTNGDLRENLIK